MIDAFICIILYLSLLIASYKVDGIANINKQAERYAQKQINEALRNEKIIKELLQFQLTLPPVYYYQWVWSNYGRQITKGRACICRN